MAHPDPDDGETPAYDLDAFDVPDSDDPAPAATPADADPEPAPSGSSGEETAEEHILRSEATVASSERGLAANDALRAMARAARSFLLYDPGNEAIKTFLAEYRDAFDRSLKMGQMELEIRPFEMMLDGECVYLEKDRERSLAFRLYRDGVRRLIIEPEVEWSELLRLLEILSIRYTGVRQNEDDVVTLLWKAGFKHIDISAVEGFVPEEDDDDAEIAEARAAAIRAAGGHTEVPSDWDTPVEPHTSPKRYAYRALQPKHLDPLKAEISSQRVADHAIALVVEMLALVGDARDPTGIDDISALLEEVRLFLLAEGQLDKLLLLAQELSRMRDIDPEAVGRELGRFVDLRALRRIVHSASRASDQAPPELEALLDMVAGEHLRDLVELLGEERSRSGRRMIRQLIERHVARNQSWLLKEIAKLDGAVAADLVRAVVHAAPDLRVELISRCLGRSEPELQREVASMLRDLDQDTVPLRDLHTFYDKAPSERVRLTLLERIVLHKDLRSFEAFVHAIDEPRQGGLSDEELTALGQALARIHAEKAEDVLTDWVRPKKWWDRVRGVTGGRNRQWAGVAGLGMLPGDEPEAAIRWLSERAGQEVHEHCKKTLYERRRAKSGGAA